ncbi:HAD family hydrolase [Curtanaerobium respiraculi]|uniref:HAD family hydrolase n=1 Tax=Curtanaerobium respiraculi TaxID=2949669 RepID=UPI0024B39D53|nr:HAD-IB family hydrolase [Curtanaerobium respiraculi]
MAEHAGQDGKPVELAVYDFDGTCITGNSPVLLVRHLLLHRKLRLAPGIGIGFWALFYKLQLPQNESWVRSQVFRAFDGMPRQEADVYLRGFYDEVIEKRFRPAADSSMRSHAADGKVVVVVSASWDAIVARALERHPFEYQVSTRMVVDERGCYTRQVDGLPVEGEEKVAAITRFADRRFGAGRWRITDAYGDHHSDIPLLEMADHPHAVTPDNPLERRAKVAGWPVLDWEAREERAGYYTYG